VHDLSCQLFHLVGSYLRAKDFGVACSVPTDTVKLTNLLLALQSSCEIPECIGCIKVTIDYPDPVDPDPLLCDIIIDIVDTDQVCNTLTFRPV